MDGDPVEGCWSGVVKRASGGYIGMSGKLVPVERMHFGEEREGTCSSILSERQEGAYSMMDCIEVADRFFRCMPCIVGFDFRLGVEE